MVIGQNSDLNFFFFGGGGLSRKMGVTEGRNSPLEWLKEHIAPILHIKYPQTATAYNTFHPGAYHYFHISQPAKKWPEEQIFCGADPLGAPVLCHVLLVSSPFFIYLLLLYFFHRFGAAATYGNALAPGLTLYHPFPFKFPFPNSSSCFSFLPCSILTF